MRLFSRARRLSFLAMPERPDEPRRIQSIDRVCYRKRETADQLAVVPREFLPILANEGASSIFDPYRNRDRHRFLELQVLSVPDSVCNDRLLTNE